MFDRLQKPFLTVETGEAYQPIRLSYHLHNKDKFIELFDTLQCIEKNPHGLTWSWYWKGECDEIRFESLDSFKRNLEKPLRLGTITIKHNSLYISLPSFKRACLAVPFFHKTIAQDIASVDHADFINKVFALDERLPHGFTELFKEKELEAIVNQRIEEYLKVEMQVEHAATAEEALAILTDYTNSETKKRLPYAERYQFTNDGQDPDVVFLGFYIFLRGRELVAIRRWFGETGYTLSNLMDDTIEEIFGNMDIDLIE